MRTIDADALKELFSEVIGHIAQKPEMNGNLEHMIRASAMVIQMIDDAPTVQPDTTTHDSIPAKTGKNDGDRTSGDCISRQQAIDEIHEDAEWLATQGSDWQTERMERDKSILMSLPSAQPEIIYCKDCVKHNKGHGYYYDGTVIGIKDCCPLVEIRGRAQGHEFDYQFCAYAERRTDD